MAGNLVIAPQDAWQILCEVLTPLPAEDLPLEAAGGAWLAADLAADRDLPPAPRSAMDGFAVRSADAAEPGAVLDVTGEVAAGSASEPAVAPGTCVRIFTGANVPPTADTVVPVEATSSRSFRDSPAETRVTIVQPCRKGANIFARGETARKGGVLLPAGTRLGPRQLAVAAAIGCAAAPVYGRPRVAVLNTGEELLEAGRSAGVHQTRNSNGPFLVAAVAGAGFPAVRRTTVPDAPDRTSAALAKALSEADAVVLTGGISAGRHDYVPGALREAGVEIAYRGVAIKPGKPQLFGQGPGGTPVFGLPGNPLSCLVGFYEFVLPALRRLAGCPLDACRPTLLVPLAESWRHDGSRALVLPAQLEATEKGTVAVPCPPVGSADLATGGRVDGAIILPSGCGQVDAGSVVQFRPWTEAASC